MGRKKKEKEPKELILIPKDKVLSEIADKKVVEQLVYKSRYCPHNMPEDTKDLIQDIYLALCKAKEELLSKMYQSKDHRELTYYIIRIINNNLYSKNSNFYYQYLRYFKMKNELKHGLKVNYDYRQEYIEHDYEYE